MPLILPILPNGDRALSKRAARRRRAIIAAMADGLAREYLESLAAIPAADATEFSYRAPLQALFQAAAERLRADGDIDARLEILHEPKREPGIGAPDFRVAAGGGAVGYVECKKPGQNLDRLLRREQLEKYRALSENILLTDSRRFVLLRGGAKAAEAVLPDAPARAEVAAFVELLARFLRHPPERVGDAGRLAELLAARCRPLRDCLRALIDRPGAGKLRGLLREFRKCVVRDLDESQFADVFAQTLVYGLFMARLNAPAGEKLDLHVARHIPRNFALVGELVDFLPELTRPGSETARWLAEDILAVVNAIDVAALRRSFAFGAKSAREADPYLYFYEHFLAKYDPKLREARGVYYTPPEVVDFIARAARDVVRSDFGKIGLADEGVYVLDFAAGTGTFLLAAMRLALEGKSESERGMIARERLARNFFGFEFMIAPYAIAHLKLSQYLAAVGCRLREGERLQVYLTNTLEPLPKEAVLPDLLPALSEDTRRAQEVKDKTPILAIVGNPPYSGVSQNRGAWIGGLIGDYMRVDGKPLGEKKHWLQDDYVKFIRFAQWKIEQAGRGIVAIVTNHAFLDNPTFRGMRQSLLSTFDRLYFLDLHGNSKKRERAPDGGKDENVFDIQQGVAISILVKNPDEKGKSIFHADFWGDRESKNAQCLESDLRSVDWRELSPSSPFYFFVPRSEKGRAEYEKFFSIPEIFPLHSTGIITARDRFAIDFSEEELLRRFGDFKASARDAEKLRQRFSVKISDEDILAAWDNLQTADDLASFAEPVFYRVFDSRRVFYEDNVVWRRRHKTMSHMLDGDNLGLVSVRQVAENDFTHAIVVDKIIESRITLSNRGIGYLYPLYLRDEKSGARIENLSPEFRLWIDSRYGRAFSARDIFNCIYAVLHSPDYRRRYADFLRTDFPRAPFPAAAAEFARLAQIGGALIDAHLLKPRAFQNGALAALRGEGNHAIDRCRYDEAKSRLFFNAEERFEPLPREVWEFEIGGYQPLKKYLQSRRDRELTLKDAETVRAAANAIAFTIEKMREIDG